MASIKRIAMELNVSRTLVSKVLSGNLGTTIVSAKRRAEILAKAKELDFRPNRLAVALKAGSKGSIGVFLHELGIPGSEVTKDLLHGIVEGLAQNGRHMWLRFFLTTEEFLSACDAKLRNEVDGLIVAGIGHPELISKFRDLESNNVPVVCGFEEVPRDALTSWTNAGTDQEMQGYLPAKHLLDLGARRIVCLATRESRTKGFLRAFLEAGIQPPSKLMLECAAYEIEDGALAIQQLLRAGVKIDGVVCQSDAQAIGVVHELHRWGIRVPWDVLVTGVDDSPLARSCLVPVTSVTSEMNAVGAKTVELLMEKIQGRTPRSLTLPPRLVVRASTGS